MTSSIFSSVEMAPRDPILGLNETFGADTRTTKVNLGVGVYFDETGKIPLLNAVKQAEKTRVESMPARGYQPIEGSPAYNQAVQHLLFGKESPLLAEGKVVTIQALGGTGALKVGADYLRRLLLGAKVYISDPSWENHRALFESAGFVVESGRALVVAVNKWDVADQEQKDRIKREIARKLAFLDFAKFHYISALQGKGVGDLFASIDQAYAAAMIKIPTPKLTRALQMALERQQPPLSGRVRPKMRYAHQGGMNPPVIVIHGNSLEHVSDAYKRFLEGRFRKEFDLVGTPLRIEMKTSSNPYTDKNGA